VPKKGVPDLILCGMLGQTQMFMEILGDGSEMESCRKLVAEFNLGDKVRFHGSNPNAYARDLIGACDIFEQPRRFGDMEGFPVTI
jgi:glycosyltransferase involved in cell wall biosynthesis